MLPQVKDIHLSDFYRIRDYRCNCDRCHTSAVEFSTAFTICFLRSGFFEYQIFRNNLETHVGRVLISKPFYEHKARHIEKQPDVCTVFSFSHDFYVRLKDHFKTASAWFFESPDIHATVIASNTQIELIHKLILDQTFHRRSESILMDDLVLQMIESIMDIIGSKPVIKSVPANLRKHHLSTVEKARNYILQNFQHNIGLQEVADHCCVSMFHFSRIFKTIMNVSPYQYLHQVRLNHAQILLRNTSKSVTEISEYTGFSNLEYFLTAFKSKYKMSPSAFRTHSQTVEIPLL
jgi:AraC family transcriptional regulator